MITQNFLSEVKPLFQSWVKEVLEECFQESTQNHKDSEESRLLNSKESQELLKCSAPTIWRLEKRGIITSHWIGGKKFFKKEELLQSLTPKK